MENNNRSDARLAVVVSVVLLVLLYGVGALCVLTVKKAAELLKPIYSIKIEPKLSQDEQYRKDCEYSGGKVVYSAFNYPDCL